MKILIIGSGGREHCLAWKMAQSPLVDKVYCAPGNGGTEDVAQNIDIAVNDTSALLYFVMKEKIDLTVVGPEVPLVEGLVDRFEEKGLKIFGPRKELAFLEGSKSFAKNIMREFKIPTADFEIFDNPQKAKAYIETKGAPIVIKADGLAAGKGVIVCKDKVQAFGAVDLIMVDKVFGDAGNKIVVEEFISGEEVSILIFTDGETILPLVSSQDHKRALDGDKGLNTGGMGAYSPAPLVDKNSFDSIIKKVFVPLITGLKKKGKIYKGILYAGLMIKDGRPYVLEFNVRFGDPEIQAILPKLKSDLADIMLKVVEGKLRRAKLEWDERLCLCVVLASGGYPSSYKKGKEIKGLDKIKDLKDIFIFHAGTVRETRDEGRETKDEGREKEEDKMKVVTNGGRVLNVVSLGGSVREAQDKAYKTIENIHFDDMQYRKDIGNKALKLELNTPQASIK
ncbi:MAG: phosphoribosylamine--glycine ligase [Candidatus Omnitrophota bacterium]